MKKEELQAKAKEIFKGAFSVIALTALVTLTTELVTEMYDHRVILGVVAGAFGYAPAVKLLSKLKGL